MKKGWLIIVPLLILAGVGVFIFFRLRSSSALINPLLEKNESGKKQEEVKFEWTEWQDPAGFSFEYPKSFEINIHEEDEVNYAHLELTYKGNKGRIIILCNDSEYADIDEWLEKDDLAKSGSSLETEIDSISARKVALGEGKEIVGFIDQDEVIYLINKQPEGENFWNRVYNRILSSFTIVPLEGESEAEFQNWLKGFNTSGVDVVESIEIIE